MPIHQKPLSVKYSFEKYKNVILLLLWGFGIIFCWEVYISRLPVQWAVTITTYQNPEWQNALHQLRLTPQWIASYILILQITTVTSSTVMAVLIAFRKFRDPLTLLLSFILVVFGVAFGAEALWAYFGENRLSTIIFILAHILISLFLYIFPDGRFAPRWTVIPQIIWTGALIAGAIFPQASLLTLPYPFFIILQIIIYGSGTVAQFHRYHWVSTPLQKQQTKWVLFGITLVFLGFLARRLSIIFLQNSLQNDTFHLLYDVLFFHPVFSIPRTLMPIFLGIAILRYRLFDIDTLINRSLVYSALTLVVGAIYVISVSLLQLIFRAITGQASEIAIVLSTALIAIIFQPLRNYLQNTVDRRFYREKINFRQAFQVFTREVRHYVDLPELLNVIVERITELFHSTHGALYLYDGDAFQLAESRRLAGTVQGLLPHSSQMEKLRAGEIVVTHPGESFSLLIPLITLWADRRELVGVLALGPKLSEAKYNREDISQLSILVDEAGTAISLAQSFIEKQHAEQQRKNAEQATQLMAANHEAVLNNIADGVLVLDLKGEFLSANPALLQMIPEGHLHEITQKPLEKTIYWKRKVFSVKAAPVPDVGTVAIFRDETRRNEVERARDALLATISHELRTPLTAVMNYLEMLVVLTRMGRANTDSFIEHLNRAIENSKRLHGLILDILDIAQIHAGRMETQKQSINLLQTLEQIQHFLNDQIEQKKLSYELIVHSDVPKEIMGDPMRFRQVLMNLINNAIKFTERGGIQIIIYCNDAKTLKIDVADTGPGIAPERLPDIFEPFRRGSDYAQREHQGAGLGLALVKQILLQMGGDISVSSEVGVGSVFTITIPVDGASE